MIINKVLLAIGHGHWSHWMDRRNEACVHRLLSRPSLRRNHSDSRKGAIQANSRMNTSWQGWQEEQVACLQARDQCAQNWETVLFPLHGPTGRIKSTPGHSLKHQKHCKFMVILPGRLFFFFKIPSSSQQQFQEMAMGSCLSVSTPRESASGLLAASGS